MYKGEIFYLRKFGNIYNYKKINKVQIIKPFSKTFNDSVKSVTFISLKDFNFDSNELVFIEKELRTNKFDLVLIPNLFNELGINPSISKEEYDNEYLFQLIKATNTPFVGYNDNDMNFIKTARKKGFTEPEILLYFYILIKRESGKYKNYEKIIFDEEGKMRELNEKEKIKEREFNIKIIMKEYEKIFKKKIIINYEELYSTYIESHGVKIPNEDILEPIEDGKYFSQRLAFLDWEIKQTFLNKLIFSYINKFDKIAIITTDKTLYSQDLVFSNTFKYEKTNQ